MSTFFLLLAIALILLLTAFLWIRRRNFIPSKPVESRAIPNFQEEFSEELDTPLPVTPTACYPTPELPCSYGVNRLVLMARDPYWLYAYWEITATKQEEFNSTFGSSAWGSSHPVLRVYDVTGVIFNGENANKYMDIEVSDQVDNWHINVGEPDHTFCVDLGRKFSDGRFVTLLRSNVVNTPRASLSDRIDEEWMWIEDLYRIRYQFGISSPMVIEEMAQRAGALPLGIGSPGFAHNE